MAKEKGIDENDLEIDEHKLVAECRKLPKLIIVYGDMLAEAEEELSRLEDRREFVRSLMPQKILDNPEKYGCTKTTDFMIKQAVIREMAMHPINGKIRKWKRRVQTLRSYMKGLDTKKRQLQNLVSLRAQQWFGDVNVDPNHREIIDAMRKEIAFASRRKKRSKR